MLDEADRMLDMGFIPQVKEIVEDFGKKLSLNRYASIPSNNDV